MWLHAVGKLRMYALHMGEDATRDRLLPFLQDKIKKGNESPAVRATNPAMRSLVGCLPCPGALPVACAPVRDVHSLENGGTPHRPGALSCGVRRWVLAAAVRDSFTCRTQLAAALLALPLAFAGLGRAF